MRTQTTDTNGKVPIPELITLREAARLLGVTERTARRWIAAGRMPHRFKEGQDKKFRRADIEAEAELLTIHQAGEVLGRSVRTLRRWLADGKLSPWVWRGREMRFRRVDLMRLKSI